MNAEKSTSQAKAKREKMISLARQIRGEFAKIHARMDEVLARAHLKKAA